MHSALSPSATVSVNINTPPFRAPFTGAGLTGLGRDCEDLLQCLPMPAYLCDLSDGLVFQNAAAALLWGGPSGKQADWSTPANFRHGDGAPLSPLQTPTAIAMRERAAAPGAGTVLRIDSLDGSARRVVAHARAVHDGAGNLMGALCFLSDVTECAALADQLQQVDDRKHEFIAMLGHEIRNPLSPILNAIPLLKQSAQTSGDKKVAFLADMIERQASSLARFVTDLLDESHGNRDGASLNKTLGSLGEVIDSALDIVGGKIGARRQTLRLQREPGEVALVCDVERLAQALGNILQNASNFTGDAGTIVLTVAVRGPLLDIEISDSGIGMRPDHVAAVFDPHCRFQLSDGQATARSGMGVRLATEICQRHGGAITARSPGLGLGSRVSIVLPVALPAA